MAFNQLEKIKNGKGFIAALDQSGGSTPKALADYGIAETEYANEDEMFDLVHRMRTRIITSPAFNSEHILGAILFKQTMDSKIAGMYTSDYLIDKGIVPFLKVDEGLADEENGVQLMKPMKGLNELLKRAKERNVFGTKMRSVIKDPDLDGIKAVVEQQVEMRKQIIAVERDPIIEPEVDIHSEQTAACEELLKQEMHAHHYQLEQSEKVMLKLTIPTATNMKKEFEDHPMEIAREHV